MNRSARAAIVSALAAISLAGCRRPAPDQSVATAEAGTPVGYGTVMAEIARRYELLGRAAVAGRYELAAYQLDEIGEAFEEAVPRASPPKEGHPEVLPAMADAFRSTQLPELKRALATHDKAQFVAAFDHAATACNGCHQASGHGFIEVPRVPGKPIPITDPVAP